MHKGSCTWNRRYFVDTSHFPLLILDVMFSSFCHTYGITDALSSAGIPSMASSEVSNPTTSPLAALLMQYLNLRYLNSPLFPLHYYFLRGSPKMQSSKRNTQRTIVFRERLHKKGCQFLFFTIIIKPNTWLNEQNNSLMEPDLNRKYAENRAEHFCSTGKMANILEALRKASPRLCFYTG